MKEIPAQILAQLNKGELETANLVEFLAINRISLLENILRDYDRIDYLQPILNQVDNLKKATSISIGATISSGLYQQIKPRNDDDFVQILSTHCSDFVRCWASEIVGQNTDLNIQQMLLRIRPFAADHHFNVRETAWTATRGIIIKNLRESIDILSVWAVDADENIRRFASESTRPRGVWCEHITELKQNPSLALKIIEPLKSDPSKYVQNSVGNWLNDASKTQPDFVIEICKRWEKESDTNETKYIIKRALRTLNKLKI
jgi:3-methyladenine DNA glycosylase AlkC